MVKTKNKLEEVDDDKVENKKSKTGTSSVYGKWTAAEDNLLREGVNELGKQWAKISQRIEGRTGNDCHHRWDRCLRPDILKAPWTEEVTLLI